MLVQAIWKAAMIRPASGDLSIQSVYSESWGKAWQRQDEFPLRNPGLPWNL